MNNRQFFFLKTKIIQKRDLLTTPFISNENIVNIAENKQKTKFRFRLEGMTMTRAWGN